MSRCDVAIVGGGPAGLAVAIAAASRGLRAVVLERGTLPVDKACGEGVLPPGLGALERAGVLPLLDRRACTPIEGIRYVQEDGSRAEGKLPAPGGLGIRRTALAEALAQRARDLGAELREECALLTHRRTSQGVELDTKGGPVEARLLVAADGLASRLRRLEGLEGEASGAPRFGIRRHYALAPWSSFVEVHLTDGAEAYVTPVGTEQVGVAVLWRGARGAGGAGEARGAGGAGEARGAGGAGEARGAGGAGGAEVQKPGSGAGGEVEGGTAFEGQLARFPQLVERLAGAMPVSRQRGAGPFARVARARVADRLVLVGDAAGYVDAVTGEGLSLALRSAEALGEVLPDALARGATRASLWPYEEAFQRIFRKYALVTHGLLQLAARPWLRRPVVRWLGRNPRAFDLVLKHTVS